MISRTSQQMKSQQINLSKTRQGLPTESKLLELQLAEFQTLNKIRNSHGCPHLSSCSHLTKLAQAYAEHLLTTNTFEHSDTNFGENLYKTSIYWSQVYSKGRATKAWHQEIQNYDFKQGRSKNGQMTGHFTAQLWRSVAKIGFGFVWGPSHHSPNFMLDLYVVALMDPPPNIPGKYCQNVPKALVEGRNR